MAENQASSIEDEEEDEEAMEDEEASEDEEVLEDEEALEDEERRYRGDAAADEFFFLSVAL